MSTAKEIRFEPDPDGVVLVIRGASGDDQLYTHALDGTFNASEAMRWARENLEPVVCELDVADVLKTMLNNDLDDRRMMQLMQLDVMQLGCETELLYVETKSGGTHTLIDAHHRLATIAAACARAGIPKLKMRGYIIAFEERDRFAVKHIEIRDGTEREVSPDELLTAISGVYSQPDGSVYRNRHR